MKQPGIMFIFLLIATIQIGCQQTKRLTAVEQRDLMIKQGVSAAYAEGYLSGCAAADPQLFTAKEIAAVQQNADTTDEAYAVGWEHGQDICEQKAKIPSAAWDELKK